MCPKDIYIFVGPPGSGKGTLSEWCVKSFGWKQLSTGNLCRQHIADETVIGRQIDFAMKSGKLIPDTIVTDMVLDWLMYKIQKASAVILDGFPRTVPQAELLCSALQRSGYEGQVCVIEFEIDDDIVIQRLAARYMCANQNCQAVYSLMSGSLCGPSNDSMLCDRCGFKLMRRNDDVEFFVKERLETYHHHKDSIMDFYRRSKVPVKKINAQVPLGLLFSQFENAVKSCAA
jgi:adenylate kinase